MSLRDKWRHLLGYPPAPPAEPPTQVAHAATRIQLEPDDFVVLTVPHVLSPDQGLALRAFVESRFAGHTALILGGGMQISAVGRAPQTESTAQAGGPIGDVGMRVPLET
jgi:hypothetical protein